jgi:hypothetical protein
MKRLVLVSFERRPIFQSPIGMVEKQNFSIRPSRKLRNGGFDRRKERYLIFDGAVRIQ